MVRAGKRKLETSVEKLEKETNELAEEAEKKMRFDKFAKSNTLRCKGAEQKKEIQEFVQKMISVN